MTHDIHHIVRLRVASADDQLLDDLEAEIPQAPNPAVEREYDVDRVELENEDGDKLYARIAFVDGEIEYDDGSTSDGPAEAADLFDRLNAYDLPADAELVQYESPIGGTTAAEVRSWYEDHPDDRPTNEDGEPYVPSSWDPSNHVVDETSG